MQLHVNISLIIQVVDFFQCRTAPLQLKVEKIVDLSTCIESQWRTFANTTTIMMAKITIRFLIPGLMYLKMVIW